MDTPIYDFLIKYADSDALRCHMPAHKGRRIFPDPKPLTELDITEISGADSLFEADGIILQSERNMSSLYGAAATFYSAGGSTLCIQAMLAAMKQEGRTVVAVRNVHRAFLNAAALLGLEVEWIMPDYTDGILSGAIRSEDVEAKLSAADRPCLYLTSPDYTGRIADIAGISAICRRYGAPLLVDNAHGAHLRFFPESRHPIDLGADMCCDSAHKMLPALTGAAMLHTSSPKYAEMLRQCMSLFASTSPSYLIMASLDLCCKYISESIRGDISAALGYIADFRSRFAGKLIFADGDPFHIAIKTGESGYDGCELAELLRENGVECEYADRGLAVLLMSPTDRRKDYERLEDALERSLLSAKLTGTVPESLDIKLPKRAMSIREAVFAPSEEIPIEEAEGRVCASVKVPCPPAVPIAASGEIIDRGCINIFKRYGISTVVVVK